MEMIAVDARKATIKEVFNGSTLIEIPFFQRSYVWKEELWARFLEDMEYITRTNKPHFLGSIILKEGHKPEEGAMYSACKTVVDGQQRLTTFLIFLKALCLKLDQSMLFDFQFRLMGGKVALRHGKNDIEAFEMVMNAKESAEFEKNSNKSRIIDAFNYFMRNMDEHKLSIMPIIMYAQFVRIDLNQEEDEQQIFDTINSLGVRLTTSELLKNYFFSRESVAEYENKWEKVFEKDDETKAYWDTEIETGRIKRALIDIFFDAYFQIFIQNRAYSITNEDKIMYARVDNLAQSYQHFITHYCHGDKSVVLDQLREYALCFKDTFLPDQCNREVPKEMGIERLNVIIFGLKTTTLIPYMLYLVKNVQEEKTLLRICGIIESYVMRRIIVHAPTKNYNNLFTSLILNNILDENSLMSRLNKTEDATTYIPSDEEIDIGFSTGKLINLQTRGIIYLLESKIRPTNSATMLLGFNNYSVEHLMPKNWRSNWGKCSSEESEKNRDSVLLTLGNLAIIPQALNASIRDAAWEQKKQGKGNRKGLMNCAAGLVTLQDVLNKEIWDEDEIKKRAMWLSSQAKAVWKI